MAKLLYFAALVDELGCAAETVEFSTDITDVRALVVWRRARSELAKRPAGHGDARHRQQAIRHAQRWD